MPPACCGNLQKLLVVHRDRQESGEMVFWASTAMKTFTTDCCFRERNPGKIHLSKGENGYWTTGHRMRKYLKSTQEIEN
jgi:hypothetical protein